jgi:starch synthase
MLEAMACSVPVVATPVNGIPEVVRNGVNGILVPVNDPVRLAEAVLPLLRDPAAAAALGRAGRQTVQRDFSMSRFVSELQGMYDGLLAGRPVAFERRHSPRQLPVLTRA